MKRENRYLVIKHKDVVKYLTEEEDILLNSLVTKICGGRIKDGKRLDKFVCVADDWPEYEEVWQMIEQRVDLHKEST